MSKFAPKSVGLERLKALLRKAPGASLLRFLYQLRNEKGRRLALLAIERPAGLFQPEPTTAEDRYPELFQLVRGHIGDGPERRILSLGCSTGEEVFSLRRYFPRARIKGIDISRLNIRSCRKRLTRLGGDPSLSFETAGSAAREPTAHYDVIFAMAVFRHGRLGEAPPRCDHLITFRDFERSVFELARSLKPGGLLVLRHANFRFGDTATAAAFGRVYLAPSSGAPTPLYGRDDRLSPDGQRDDGVYEKR